MVQESYLCSCDRPKSIHIGIAISNVFLVFILGLLNLPFGISHIASVIETDGASGNPIKPFPRGPTVAPYPSPETLDQFVQSNGDDDSFFNPAEALRNLLSLSSSNRVQGLKRVSQFHGNVGGGVGHYGLMGGGGLGTYYQQSPHLKSSWDSDENGMMEEDEEDEKPTFVPFIGARALTNIPQFFEHLKENIEALKVSPDDDDSDQDSDDTSTEDNNQDARLAKPAARRTKTELLVDENRGRSTPNRQSDSSTLKQSWKPRAAGIVHYYAPKSNFLESHQNMLRRANNYNPAWLYTNLGLGKRRR